MASNQRIRNEKGQYYGRCICAHNWLSLDSNNQRKSDFFFFSAFIRSFDCLCCHEWKWWWWWWLKLNRFRMEMNYPKKGGKSESRFDISMKQHRSHWPRSSHRKRDAGYLPNYHWIVDDDGVDGIEYQILAHAGQVMDLNSRLRANMLCMQLILITYNAQSYDDRSHSLRWHIHIRVMNI